MLLPTHTVAICNLRLFWKCSAKAGRGEMLRYVSSAGAQSRGEPEIKAALFCRLKIPASFTDRPSCA